MFKALFDIILNLLATLVQIVVYPINLVIESALPDLSSKILEVTTTFSNVFSSVGWALGLLPTSVITTLIFILGVEIAKHTIFISTHALVKVWNLFQKLKFW